MSDIDASVNRIGPSSSGLTLVLPSLKALKELNAKKRNSPILETTPVKKVSRPIKLKPLKEVLTSLISKIKKKDDYAFFLEPVNLEKVPGYMDVIKQPMDFGTMADKVSKSKYRSLDEFADDFRLVISNAKTFNLPGTIYHNEAERIEAWASDHISKAASYVIEYETDWNIEVERDEDVNVDADEDGVTGGVPAGPDTPGRRSPSVASASNRTGTFLGFKDGVGVFPPGSDWAEVMLALKLKGKRYRSKKERLRMEKGGPPYAADGSLDYAESEFNNHIVPHVLIPVMQWKTHSACFLPLSPTHHQVKVSPLDITRPAPQRSKAKEAAEEHSSVLDSRKPRLLHTTDFGLFPTIATKLSSGGVMGTEEELFAALRTSLESAARSEDSAHQAQSWLREVVYGGIDGLAYVRSVAEFRRPTPWRTPRRWRP
ncbi:hypothetical protein BJY52DRAFT_1359855 [Lactarius psammicola]|nr:hypothetical protein BJY52DRAFT_1359855 [Lactarius psammicola]